MTGPAAGTARAAYRAAFQSEVADVGVGGTIPFISEFSASFPESEILVTSAGADPLCGAHGIDESLPLDDFASACVAEALLLVELAAGSDDRPRPRVI